MNVFVLEYSHKHGNDVMVFETEEDAFIGACDIILEWTNSEEEGYPAILRQIQEGNFKRAVSLWLDMETGENIFIEERTVIRCDDSRKTVHAAMALLDEMKQEE